MGTYLTRSGGIPRLQPTGLPSKPPANGFGQRFVTERPAANIHEVKGSIGSKPGTNGPGQSFLSTRQIQPPKAYRGKGGGTHKLSNPTLP